MSTARATLDTARFFCDAAGRAADDVEAFRRYLQAAIVFARSVTFHLQKEYSDSAGFKDSWWPQK